MTVLLAVVVVALIGSLNTFGTALNGKAGREIGTVRATCLFLGVGALWALGLAYFLEDGLSIEKLQAIPAHLFIPGIVNVVFIAAMIRLVNVLGAMLTQGSIFSGQMLASLVLDQAGLAGLQALPVTPGRLAGTVMLLLGVGLLAAASGSRDGPVVSDTTDGDDGAVARNPITGRAVFAAVMLGTAISTATAFNASLGTLVGPLTSAGLFLLPGAVLLGIYLLASGWFHRKSNNERWRFSWAFVAPGSLNVAVVMAPIVFIPLVGVQLVMATTICAAVLTGLLVVDKFGLFGLPTRPITLPRIVGAATLIGGVVVSLMFR